MKLPKKLLISGFNGFSQFKNITNELITSFTEWDYKTALQLGADSVTNFQIVSKFSYNAISIDHTLYICGSINGEFGQWRRHSFEDVIKQISANDNYTLILLENGTVYKLEIDSNTLSQLSFLNVECDSSKKESIQHIQSGGTFSIAITNNNDLYCVPSKIQSFPKHVKIRKICCGAEHTIFLTTNGDVYAFGSSARGQLGLGCLETEHSPVLVDALAGIKIVDIAAGYWHSAAVSAFGDLYEWGWNYNAQMGRPVFKLIDVTYKSGKRENIKHKLQTVFASPEIIEIAPNEDLDSQLNVSKVFAGHRHTIALTELGKLFGCGWNRYGQLGKDDTENDVEKFEEIVFGDLAMGEKLVDVVCGDWCTILVINFDVESI